VNMPYINSSHALYITLVFNLGKDKHLHLLLLLDPSTPLVYLVSGPYRASRYLDKVESTATPWNAPIALRIIFHCAAKHALQGVYAPSLSFLKKSMTPVKTTSKIPPPGPSLKTFGKNPL
jgi:hypothetical protein